MLSNYRPWQDTSKKLRRNGTTISWSLITVRTKIHMRHFATNVASIYNPAVACRRPILDPGYLACLHKPNVELVWDSIRDISDTEITTEKGIS